MTEKGPRRLAPTMDRTSAAIILGCAPQQIGPCARCQGLTVRYGSKAEPVCRACRAAESKATST
ncbi:MULTISPECIES: hypothetical protein [unclassified Streptomyces]|uniref:hypothetical protein n=1 Tax=unclassified Streptomyces TaxID=2593676 RepID=UPI0034262D8C